MEDKSPPPAGRARKPRTRKAVRTASSGSAAQHAGRPASPEAATPAAAAVPSNGNPVEPPPAFDRIVADDGFARDFDRLASDNPRSAVLTALAVGVAIGFVAGILMARD
ncbi:MAG TPA: hypothetical protein VIZ58_01815 [Thermoanaerobaculia bacterium]